MRPLRGERRRSSVPCPAGVRALSFAALFDARRVSQRDERIALQVAAVVPRHVQPVVAPRELARLRAQPVDERNDRLSARLLVRAAFLDPAVPRADVLAGVAAVDAVLE